MDYVFDLIKSYGEWFYVITFIWTFFEGETFVIFSATQLLLMELRMP